MEPDTEKVGPSGDIVQLFLICRCDKHTINRENVLGLKRCTLELGVRTLRTWEAEGRGFHEFKASLSI